MAIIQVFRYPIYPQSLYADSKLVRAPGQTRQRRKARVLVGINQAPREPRRRACLLLYPARRCKPNAVRQLGLRIMGRLNGSAECTGQRVGRGQRGLTRARASKNKAPVSVCLRPHTHTHIPAHTRTHTHTHTCHVLAWQQFATTQGRAHASRYLLLYASSCSDVGARPVRLAATPEGICLIFFHYHSSCTHFRSPSWVQTSRQQHKRNYTRRAA